MRSVTHIVSIGKACRITFQLRRYYNFGLSFPFDWWVSKIEGISAAISPEFDPYSPDFLQEVEMDGEIRSITSCNGAIVLHHEFQRDYTKQTKPISPKWRDQITKNRDVFLRRRQRLFDLNNDTNGHCF